MKAGGGNLGASVAKCLNAPSIARRANNGNPTNREGVEQTTADTFSPPPRNVTQRRRKITGSTSVVHGYIWRLMSWDYDLVNATLLKNVFERCTRNWQVIRTKWFLIRRCTLILYKEHVDKLRFSWEQYAQLLACTHVQMLKFLPQKCGMHFQMLGI